MYQKLSFCSLFHLKNLDLWCRQDWGGDEEDEEDGRVGGGVDHDDQQPVKTSIGNMSAGGFYTGSKAGWNFRQ